ncbi:alpha-tocopherol transfer protein isoform X5 [Panthera tigris]|uniref:alpha-tocopherol transfer protein isoform X5 n=1 Tax=Panthera tigris TaxID=9694 RepID=UPI001C6F673C|nr:alpha-tocopherol transfer protein isoform X5 [Panthera tigris]
MRRGGSAPVRPRAPPSRVASAASFGRARMLRGARRAAVAGSRPEWEASALWAGSAAARDCGAGPEAQGRRRPPYDGEDVGGLQRRSHRRTAPGARAAVAGPPPEPPEAIHGHVGGWVSQPPSGQSCWAFRKSSHVQRKWPGPRDSGGISAQVDHSCHFPRLLPPFQLLFSICGVPILHSHTELYGVQEFAATCYEGGKNIQEEACEILQALSLIIFVENNGFGIQPTGV